MIQAGSPKKKMLKRMTPFCRYRVASQTFPELFSAKFKTGINIEKKKKKSKKAKNIFLHSNAKGIPGFLANIPIS